MLIAIILLATLYLGHLFSSTVLTISICLIVLILIFISIFYGIFGLISGLSLSLLLTLMLVFLKFLEISFSWNIYLALLVGLMFAINDVLLLLEKTRINLKNDWGIVKSFETAKSNVFIINVDKNLIIFAISSVMFLINKNEISTIAAMLVISITLSFIIISILNQNLISLFIKLPIKHNHKIFLGLSNKLKLNKNKNFLKKAKYVKFGMWSFIGIGLILVTILAPLDASGTAKVFQSSVASGLSKEIIIDGVTTIFISLAILFIYIFIKYHYSFALSLIFSLLQDILILTTFFVISRLTINSSFVASLLVLLTISSAFSINSFKDLKNRIEIHVGQLDKDTLYKNINEIIKGSLLRIVYTLYFVLISTFIVFNIDKINMFAIGILIGSLIAIVSSKLITLVVLTKFELRRLKKVEKRVKNNFWKTQGKEEQIINGINNYKA